MDPKLCKSGVFCTAAQFEKQQFRMEGIAKIEVSKRNKCIEIKKKYKKLRKKIKHQEIVDLTCFLEPVNDAKSRICFTGEILAFFIDYLLKTAARA